MLNKNNISLLFLGRAGCSNSIKIIDFLKKSNITLEYLLTRERGEKIKNNILGWSGDYIISFRNYFILPKEMLVKTKKYAINIHPGSPEYRGSGCFNWALYQNASTYGVTAHIMDEKIDNGPIIESRRFKLDETIDLDKLIRKTHNLSYKLTLDIINGILINGTHFIEDKLISNEEKWSGKKMSIKALDKLLDISPSVSKEELEKIIKATKYKKFKPYIMLHGYKFFLESVKK